MSAPEWHRSSGGGFGVSETRTYTVVSRMVAALRELGIELTEPVGRVTVDPVTLYADIGSLIILETGTVLAVPAEDATTEQMGEVVRQAKAARISGPVGAWWKYEHGLGHVCSVFEPPN
ncbi:hypothetical protein [Nocardia nova]|nr:hypothetical protein [Nocardia nova]